MESTNEKPFDSYIKGVFTIKIQIFNTLIIKLKSSVSCVRQECAKVKIHHPDHLRLHLSRDLQKAEMVWLRETTSSMVGQLLCIHIS